MEMKTNMIAYTRISTVERRLHPQLLKDTAVNDVGECSADGFDKAVGRGQEREQQKESKCFCPDPSPCN